MTFNILEVELIGHRTCEAFIGAGEASRRIRLRLAENGSSSRGLRYSPGRVDDLRHHEEVPTQLVLVLVLGCVVFCCLSDTQHRDVAV